MGMVIYLRRASPADIGRLVADAEGWEEFAFDEGDPDADLIDFDKAWHALHFMLTGTDGLTSDPLGIIAGDAETFGADENGFGGFSVVSPERMAAFDKAISLVDEGALRARYDPPAMAELDLYLSDVFVEEGEEALDYVMQSVPALRRFAQFCARSGAGALRIIG